MTKKYILGALNLCLLATLLILLFVGILQVGLYDKATNIFIISSLIFLLILLTCTYLSRSYKRYNIGTFVALLLNIIIAFQVIELNNSYSYIENTLSKKYIYETYELYVQKTNTKYNKIEKLENKKIGILKNNDSNVRLFINKKVKVEFKEYENINELSEGIKNGEIQAFIIEDSNKNELNDNKISGKVRVIYTNKIKKNI